MTPNRYSRQISLIGENGQENLRRGSILIVGAGGIGSPASIYLIAAGIGTIGIIDHDIVEITNLQRQILYTEKDIGKQKVDIARNRLAALNPNVNLLTFSEQLSIENAARIIGKFDLVIDGSDNFKTRYLVNDICCQLNIPFINASVFQYSIQLTFFDITNGCYRCAFPEPPPPLLISNCAESGVLGPTTGIAGSMAASWGIQFFIEKHQLPTQVIKCVSSLNIEINTFKYQKNHNCSSCCQLQLAWPAISPFDVHVENIRLTNFVIIDIRENHEDRSKQLSASDSHIPLSSLDRYTENLQAEEKILLYCQSGVRSSYAAYVLNKLGVKAYSLAGGINLVK